MTEAEKAAVAAEQKKNLDALLAKAKADGKAEGIQEAKSQQLTDEEQRKKSLFFAQGGGGPTIHVPKWDKALDTPSMDDHQRMYLQAKKDPDLMYAMRQLGAMVITVQQTQGQSKQERLGYVKERFPQFKAIHEHFEKALTVTVPSGGGFTVPMPVLEPIIPFLYNRVAVRQLGATVIDLPNGNGTLPRVNTASAASYQGEALPAAETGPVLGDVKLSVKKLMALVPMSNDLILSNSVNYEATVAQDLVNIMNIKADATSIYGDGTLNTPTGLKNLGIQTYGTSTTPLTGDDPFAIVGLLDQSNVPMLSPGWIVNGKTKAWLNNLKTSTGAYIFRDEISRGELAGYPIVMSNQVTYTSAGNFSDFVFGDFSEFVWGEQTMLEMEQSREATYKDAGGNLQSAFANDLTLIRAISRHDFNVKHPVSFVLATMKLASS